MSANTTACAGGALTAPMPARNVAITAADRNEWKKRLTVTSTPLPSNGRRPPTGQRPPSRPERTVAAREAGCAASVGVSSQGLDLDLHAVAHGGGAAVDEQLGDGEVVVAQVGGGEARQPWRVGGRREQHGAAAAGDVGAAGQGVREVRPTCDRDRGRGVEEAGGHAAGGVVAVGAAHREG